MLPSMSQRIEENWPILLPYFSAQNTLETDVDMIGRYLNAIFPVRAVALARMTSRGVAAWSQVAAPAEMARLSEHLLENREALVVGAAEGGCLEDAALRSLLALEAKGEAYLRLLRYNGQTYGLLLVQRAEGMLLEEERQMLSMLLEMMGAGFATRVSIDKEELSSFVFNTMLDSMKASIYITDLETDRILFMNQTMKQEYGVSEPEGEVCYKILQKGMNERCPFCPVPELLEKNSLDTVVQWDETSSVNGRAYRNYDSLIRWIDGSIVHLQQSVDMSELRSANTDEVTQMLTRRAGKKALERTLLHAREKGQSVTVCLFNVNELKQVNDRYGHVAGDYFISATARAIRSLLVAQEYAFRLSGDEFVAVFYRPQGVVRRLVCGAQSALRAEETPYEIGFCFGLIEIQPEAPMEADEVLALSDERMYEQKRQFRIQKNEERLRYEGFEVVRPVAFQYDAARLYDALVKSTDDYLYICNMKTGVFRYSRAMVEDFDLPGEVISNAAAIWGAKIHKDDRSAFLEANQEIEDGRATAHCVEYRAQNRHGEWVWVRCRGHLERDDAGEPVLFAGFITNLGKKSKLDNLTGLFNHLEFEEHVRHLTESESDTAFAMVILGIDDFKHINDLYDRSFGDEILRITAQRLQSLLPSTASLYRLDGDEFGIIIRGVRPEEVQRLLYTVHTQFDRQQEYDGKRYYCTLSGGCTFFPQDARDYLDLLKYTGYSLEHAKSHGKKRTTFFSKDILQHRSRTLEMVEALRESVEHDCRGFSLRFQAVVHADSGKLAGLESLLRWEHERFGMVSPVEFIPMLEQTGMINVVGKWVLRDALRATREWCLRLPALSVHVNLSYHQIEGNDFLPFLRRVIEEEGYQANQLVLEMTESYFAQEDAQVDRLFAELRAMGVRIAMDDFGTGYSSLGILKRSPADIVKVDKTFIRDILTSSFDATFIRFIVALCHDVGIEVCLEGVETEEEYRFVSTMGLDGIQGFYFCKPLPEGEFAKKYFAIE